MFQDYIIQDHESIIHNYFLYRNCDDRSVAKQYFDNLIRDTCQLFIGEELILYPIIQKHLEVNKEIIRDLIDEHQDIKNLFEDLRSNYDSEYFDKKLTLIMEDLMNHFFKEEKELFPKIKNALSKTEENELTEIFKRRKKPQFNEINIDKMLISKSEDFSNLFELPINS